VTTRALQPWPGELLQLGGTRLFVRRTEHDGAPPVIFVHGLGGASTNWTDLMGLIGAGADGYALDLPGFGQSDPPTAGRYPLAVHVRAVVALLESLSGPVQLWGNSLGGATALRVAATRPDLVTSLVFVSPALPDLHPRRGVDPRLALLLLPGLGRVAQRRMDEQDPVARTRALLDYLYADPSRVVEERVEEAAEELRRRSGLPYAGAAFTGSLRGLIASWAQRGGGSLWRQVPRISVPTLLLGGLADPLVAPRVLRRAHTMIPGAELELWPDVGHVAQLEVPERVLTRWQAWGGTRLEPVAR